MAWPHSAVTHNSAIHKSCGVRFSRCFMTVIHKLGFGCQANLNLLTGGEEVFLLKSYSIVA